jgi:murein DD-endopeptidase MepM/ murein hydrolase activator NlpD
LRLDNLKYIWEFIKRLFSEQEDVTVFVLYDDNPDPASRFKITRFDVIAVLSVVVAASICLSVIAFFITPLSSMYQQQVDEQFRDEVVAINERVLALQDSLNAREIQLEDLKNFVRSVPDTTFDVEVYTGTEVSMNSRISFSGQSDVSPAQMLTRNHIMTSSRIERTEEFPSFFPVEGQLTQEFSSELGHFGIDIAARENSEFKVIADGSVMNTKWTINYGNIIYVQHEGGIVSVYKHAARLFKEPGDYVLKGDVIGLVGDRGLLSTGSHLHIEIWKDGMPQNPLIFLN